MIKTAKEAREWLEDKEDDVIVEIKEKRAKSIRSKRQNDYYWGVVIEYIAEFVGMEHKFEKYQIHKDIKEYFEIETTTGLSKSEFKAVIDEIIAWWQEKRELRIPKPNEHEEYKSLCKSFYN